MRAFALATLVILAPASALAFSDREMFADPVEQGGAAGRYFTGSRAEGYACSVCHQGGTPPRFEIDPLPAQLAAGQRYTLVVHWPDPTSPQALTVELATANGSHPQVTIPTGTAIPATSRCEGMSNGTPAVYSVDIGTRRVIGVEDCGASRVEVSFVATGDPIEVSVAGVRSNEDGSPNGDGVFEQRFKLDRLPQASACTTVGHPGGAIIPLLALLLVCRRRRSGKLDAE